MVESNGPIFWETESIRVENRNALVRDRSLCCGGSDLWVVLTPLSARPTGRERAPAVCIWTRRGAADTNKQRDVWSLDDTDTARTWRRCRWIRGGGRGVDGQICGDDESSRRFQVRSVLLCEPICQRRRPRLLSSTDSCDVRHRRPDFRVDIGFQYAMQPWEDTSTSQRRTRRGRLI